ncbi:MAG: GC-type dockerin domain-anchored protein [Phycisphaerales bacterium JB054]
MVYDSWRGVTVHFGGNAEWQDDTWEWDGTRWDYVPIPGPAARESHAMAFDSIRGVTVLHGGYGVVNGSGVRYSDTWEYDGIEWRLVDSTGFGKRTVHAMAFDERRGVTVAYSGYNDNGSPARDTWEWDGQSWTQVATDGPPYMSGHRMMYDPVREQCLLIGGHRQSGSGDNDDIWMWDGTQWTLVVTDGPGERLYPAAAFHGGTDRFVVFGGSSGTDEMWELTISGPPVISSDPEPVEAQAGDTVELFVTAESGLGMEFQWLQDGTPLTDGGRVSGATTDHLTILDAVWADEGDYTVLVSNRCGSVESNSAAVTVHCHADFNGDYALDTLDVLLFLNSWSSGSQSADYDGNGTVNTLDFLAFLNDWVAGC